MEFYQGFYLFLRKGIEIGSMVCLSRSDRQIFNQARSQFNKRKNYRELVKSVTDSEVICHGDDQKYECSNHERNHNVRGYKPSSWST